MKGPFVDMGAFISEWAFVVAVQLKLNLRGHLRVWGHLSVAAFSYGCI